MGLFVKLGNDTIGVRRSQPLVDGNGDPVVDEFGDQEIGDVYVEIRWCQVSPTGRTGDTTEPEGRSGPALSARTVLAPPGSDIDMAEVVIWPITGRTGEGPTLQLSGREWAVIGEPHPWGDCLQVEMRAGT